MGRLTTAHAPKLGMAITCTLFADTSGLVGCHIPDGIWHPSGVPLDLVFHEKPHVAWAGWWWVPLHRSTLP